VNVAGEIPRIYRPDSDQSPFHSTAYYSKRRDILDLAWEQADEFNPHPGNP
jgi:hypothetical protein